MADMNDLSLKLDRILAGQEEIRQRVASNELASELVLKALREQMLPALHTVIEIATKIHELATAEPAGGGELTEALRAIATGQLQQTELLERVGTSLDALVAEMMRRQQPEAA